MAKTETTDKRECRCTWGTIPGRGYGVVKRDPDCTAHETLADEMRRWASSLSEYPEHAEIAAEMLAEANTRDGL